MIIQPILLNDVSELEDTTHQREPVAGLKSLSTSRSVYVEPQLGHL